MSHFSQCCWCIFYFLSLTGCVIKPKAEFVDSFYTYQDKQGKKYFSYILEVKGSGKYQQTRDRNLLGSGRNNSKNDSQSQEASQLKSISMIGDPEDARVSLKFRMEELAYKKLDTKLLESGYCPDSVKFEEGEYLDLRYKIKGFCIE